MPRGQGDGGNGNGAEDRIDGAGVERRSSGRSGRRVGRAAEVRGSGRPERKFTEAGARGWRFDRAARRPGALARREPGQGGGCWKLRPLPGLARGSGRKPQTEGRFLSRLGRALQAPRGEVTFPAKILIRPCEIGAADFLAFRIHQEIQGVEPFRNGAFPFSPSSSPSSWSTRPPAFRWLFSPHWSSALQGRR
jgi:hypothetical protein